MNKFRREAMEKEFPQISTILKMVEREGKLDNIQVKRLDENILRKVPYESVWEGSRVGGTTLDRIFIFGGENQVLGEVGQGYDFRSNYAYTDPRHEEGEAIGEAIDRLQCADRMTHIIWVIIDGKIVDHYSQQSTEITIYKLPKGATIGELVEKWRTEEREKVLQEITF